MSLREGLKINTEQVTERIAGQIRSYLSRLKKRGVVLGLSGGVDSSVTAALCVRACGPDKVFGIFMPEDDSSPDSLRLGQEVATYLRIRSEVEDVGPVLAAAGCYDRRDRAIRSVIPEYGEGWRAKIVLPDVLAGAVYALYSVVARSPDGDERRARLPLDAYLTIVAATNFKQRTRKMMEYFHADRLNYAVAGTPNLLEMDQGFFVKNGDGAADFKPIAHLYKTQVYALAEYLNVPAEIRNRRPTTDTYALEQTQEEFYFALPYEEMDLLSFGLASGVSAAEVAAETGMEIERVERVYALIASRRRAARYLGMPALMEDSRGHDNLGVLTTERE